MEEQYRSPELSALYRERDVESSVHYHKKLLAGPIFIGVFKSGDMRSIALLWFAGYLPDLDFAGGL